MSRARAVEFDPPGGAVLVAIRNPRSATTETAGWSDVLHLEFHDIDEPYEDFQLFSFQQARQVCDFVDRHLDRPLLAAHCDHGVSRSAAVALLMSRLTGVSLSADAGGYNKLVYKRLTAAWVLKRLTAGRFVQAWRDFRQLEGD